VTRLLNRLPPELKGANPGLPGSMTLVDELRRMGLVGPGWGSV
jgi:hypothetical protein